MPTIRREPGGVGSSDSFRHAEAHLDRARQRASDAEITASKMEDQILEGIDRRRAGANDDERAAVRRQPREQTLAWRPEKGSKVPPPPRKAA